MCLRHPDRKEINQRGFTLIELMVVLIILGLLIGIVAPNVYKKLTQGQNVAAKTQVQQLEAAIISFASDMGRFPTTEEGLNALVENPDGSELWAGPYLSKKKIPQDPWKHDYVYVFPGEHGTEFDLYSKGQDGQTGTKDDLNNWE